jgi:hypothetical protein
LLQSRVEKLGPLVQRMLKAFLVVVGSGVLESPSKAVDMGLVADANGFVKLFFKLFKFVVLTLKLLIEVVLRGVSNQLKAELDFSMKFLKTLSC